MSGNILTPEQRDALLAVMRGRRVEALKVRRANAPVAPGDDGNGVGLVSRILHLDPDTVRGRLRGFGGTGPGPVDPAACPEREGRLTRDREASPVTAPPETPPRDTDGVRAIILERFGVEYTRGGAVRLMHRLGFGYIKPKPLPRQAGRAGREAFIRKYGRLMRDAPPGGTLPREREAIAESGTGTFRVITHDGYRMAAWPHARLRPCGGGRISP